MFFFVHYSMSSYQLEYKKYKKYKKEYLVCREQRAGKITRHWRLSNIEKFKERVSKGPERCCEYLSKTGKVDMNEMECLFLALVLDLILETTKHQNISLESVYEKFCDKTDDILSVLQMKDDCKQKMRLLINCFCKGRGARIKERLSMTESDSTSTTLSTIGSVLGGLISIGLFTISIPTGLIGSATYLQNIKNRHKIMKLSKYQRGVRFAKIYTVIAYLYQIYTSDHELSKTLDQDCITFKTLQDHEVYLNDGRSGEPYSIKKQILLRARALANEVIEKVNDPKKDIYKDALHLREKLDTIIEVVDQHPIEKRQLYSIGIFL